MSKHVNIALLQFNFKGFKGKDACVFNRPGYETDRNTQLKTHDLKVLVDEKPLTQSVNAIARIQKRSNPDPQNNLLTLSIMRLAKYSGLIKSINRSLLAPLVKTDLLVIVVQCLKQAIGMSICMGMFKAIGG